MSPFEKFCAAFIACCLLVLALYADGSISWHLGYNKGYQDGLNAPGKVDTVTVVDTYYVDKPVPVEVIKWKDKLVPVPIPVDSLVYVHDTAWVELPLEQKIYRDSTYAAQVSGVQPNLDWIEVYSRTQIVTKTVVEPAPRWSLGLTAGPGLLWNQNGFHAGVGAVVGVQYRF